MVAFIRILICLGICLVQVARVSQAQSAKVDEATPDEAIAKLYTYNDVPDHDGIGKFYFGREISQVMGHLSAGWLERSSREVEEAPMKLMEALKLKPGMAVADIGAGSGYFTRRIARRIAPDGIVYAVDIQPEMIKILEANMKKHGLTNYRSVLNTEQDPKLAAESVDLVIMVDVYHEFAYPHEMMTAIRKALRPGGRVVFVEYRGEDVWVPIKPLHKMTQAQVKKEASAQGFKWIETLDVLPRQHIIVFEKE
ncbi:MAG: Ubiquinone/menaquinone biosynthesis C-methyltransferase UbiE [Verrucomicrobia subdivision 3 bacterium]|nr:Ubiquinone/menaquinone biosynthesis C-methyltransferase UbiE [Limisphaerales bacterium]MCS1412748.1 Ubiquinone/menaquinone biosynthesis C-methyltransferase UbiE [Limisphaerales bacterium]